MSRHYYNFSNVLGEAVTHKIVVGWHPVLRSYYFQVYRDPNYIHAVSRIGTSSREIPTVELLNSKLKKLLSASIPDEIQVQLRREITEEGYPPPNESLQELLDFENRGGQYK